ncbi:MAG: hypothetical protein ABL959_17165, partial [Pyrinomonadaceae bacterium]
GTGMKHYRNVEIAYDPTQNRKQEDEFDEMGDMIRGGLPMPLIEPADIDDGAFIDEDVDIDIDLEAPDADEEAFDIDEAMKIEVEDDEL